ncbi:MAG: DMT family transporter, partial [Hyphomicrobiaceae bacterium]
LGFIGVMIIVQPGSASLGLGTGLAVLCALMFAFNLIGTKYLTRQDSPLTIILFMTVNHTVLSFLIAARTLPLPDAYTAVWLFMLGAASLAAHFGLAQAISHADAIVVAPMDFMRLPLIAAVGMLVYSEQPHALVLLGAAIVLGANVLNLWGEHRTRQRASLRVSR